MTDKESDNSVSLPRRKDGEPVSVKEGDIIVKGMEKVLELLDQGYEVIEELNGERFLMAKKDLPAKGSIGY